MATDLAIETRGLSRRFGDTLAVDDLDLSVRKGEIYGFLGPNGAGKTTVVRMLVTLLSPTSGEARVMGHDVLREAAAVRLGIGVALQEASLDDQQTGVELLRLQARLYGLSSGEFDERIDHLRQLIDIGEALDHRIGTYSGGMRRRLSLAAALVHNPAMLFLDEPTTGLDPVNRRAMWEEIVRLNEDVGISILLTTQYLDEADALAHRVGIIDEGRLVAEGTPRELRSEIGNDVVVVQTEGDLEAVRTAMEQLANVEDVEIRDHELLATTADGAGAVGAIARVFDEQGLPLDKLVIRTPTLDDVFLDATGNRLSQRGGNGRSASDGD